MLTQVVAEAKVDHRLLTRQDAADITPVPDEDHDGQDPGHQGKNPVMLTQGDDEDRADADDAGHAGHTGQEQGGDEDQAGNPEQGRVIGQQDSGAGGHGLTTMEVVKDRDGVPQGGEEPN